MSGSPLPDSGGVRLVEEIYHGLVELIRAGTLSPESRLHQVSLAEQFGVSRTPVREALLRLEQAGLAYTVPRRGMFVRSFTHDDVVQLYEFREVLEPWAARLACQRATGADRAALVRIQSQHEAHLPSFESNRKFHIALVASCGNAMALRVLHDLWALSATEQMYQVYQLQPGSLSNMVAEHRAIVHAFSSGESDLVSDLVMQHISGAGEITAATITDHQPL